MGQLLSKKDETRALILGLDAAGKTSLLYRWQLGEVVTTIPTIGFNVETVNWKSFNITAWDVGGRCHVRPLMRHYYSNTDGIVFVVDAADEYRFSEVEEEIKRLASEDDSIDVPVVVVANKQDLVGAVKAEKLIEKLDLHNLLRKRPWVIVETSITKNEGVSEILEHLVSMMSRAHAKAIIRGALALNKGKSEEKDEAKEVQNPNGSCLDLLSSSFGYKYMKGTLKKVTTWF